MRMTKRRQVATRMQVATISSHWSSFLPVYPLLEWLSDHRYSTPVHSEIVTEAHLYLLRCFTILSEFESSRALIKALTFNRQSRQIEP